MFPFREKHALPYVICKKGKSLPLLRCASPNYFRSNLCSSESNDEREIQKDEDAACANQRKYIYELKSLYFAKFVLARALALQGEFRRREEDAIAVLRHVKFGRE